MKLPILLLACSGLIVLMYAAFFTRLGYIEYIKNHILAGQAPLNTRMHAKLLEDEAKVENETAVIIKKGGVVGGGVGGDFTKQPCSIDTFPRHPTISSKTQSHLKLPLQVLAIPMEYTKPNA